jgi:hypothetical protein
MRAPIDDGVPAWLSLAGAFLERWVAAQVIQGLQPASLELRMAAEPTLRAEREQGAAHWHQRLERAHSNAQRAARQYAAVEPENRLVARTLERQWEEALRHEQQLHEAYARFRRERPLELTSPEREAIRRLAQDVPALWQAPETTAQDRQESVRLLVERVTVKVHEDREQVEVTLQWAGGVTSTHRLRRPVARYDQLSTYPDLLAHIAGLRQTGHSFAQMAAQLNRAGCAPPQRTERLTGETVARLLSRHGLHGPRPRAMDEARVLRAHEDWLAA